MANKKVYTNLDFGQNSSIINLGRIQINPIYDHIALEITSFDLAQTSDIVQINDALGSQIWRVRGNSIIEVNGNQKISSHTLYSGYSSAILSGIYHSPILKNAIISGSVDALSSTKIINYPGATIGTDVPNYNQVLQAKNTALSGSIVRSPGYAAENTIVIPNASYKGIIITPNVSQSADIFQTLDGTGELAFRINSLGNAIGNSAITASGLVPLNQVNVILSGHTNNDIPHPLDRFDVFSRWEHSWENIHLTNWTFVASGSTPPIRYMYKPRYLTALQHPTISKIAAIDGSTGVVGNEGGCSYLSGQLVHISSGTVIGAIFINFMSAGIQTARIGFWGNDDSNISANGRPPIGFWLEYDRSVSTTDWRLSGCGSGGVASVQASGFILSNDKWQYGAFVSTPQNTLEIYRCIKGQSPILAGVLSGANIPVTAQERQGSTFWQMTKIVADSYRPIFIVYKLGKITGNRDFPLFPG